jgi:hypothetical protein
MRRTLLSLAALAVLAACNGSPTDTVPGGARFDGVIGSGTRAADDDGGMIGSGTLSSDTTSRGGGTIGSGTLSSDTTSRGGGTIGSGT